MTVSCFAMPLGTAARLVAVGHPRGVRDVGRCSKLQVPASALRRRWLARAAVQPARGSHMSRQTLVVRSGGPAGGMKSGSGGGEEVRAFVWRGWLRKGGVGVTGRVVGWSAWVAGCGSGAGARQVQGCAGHSCRTLAHAHARLHTCTHPPGQHAGARGAGGAGRVVRAGRPGAALPQHLRAGVLRRRGALLLTPGRPRVPARGALFIPTCFAAALCSRYVAADSSLCCCAHRCCCTAQPPDAALSSPPCCCTVAPVMGGKRKFATHAMHHPIDRSVGPVAGREAFPLTFASHSPPCQLRTRRSS